MVHPREGVRDVVYYRIKLQEGEQALATKDVVGGCYERVPPHRELNPQIIYHLNSKWRLYISLMGELARSDLRLYEV